jgi:hypothetical protein
MRGAVKHCEILSNLLNNSLLMLQAKARWLEKLDACDREAPMLKDHARQCTAVFEACRASVKAVGKVQGQLGLCIQYSIESSDLELIKALHARGYWLVRSAHLTPSVQRGGLTSKKDTHTGPADKKAADAKGGGRGGVEGVDRDPLVLVSSHLILQENDGGDPHSTAAAAACRKLGAARCRAVLSSTYGAHTEYEQQSEEGDVIRFGHVVRWYRDRWSEVAQIFKSTR